MAKTVAQLESVLGAYIEPNGVFLEALAQVLPRVYNLGLWRDLVFETSLPAAVGYISLPTTAESVISCTINDNPRPVRSLWHDVRIVGRQADVSPYFGIVDDGLRPVARDVADISDAEETELDGSALTAIYAVPSGEGRTDWLQLLSDDTDVTLTLDRVDGGIQRVSLSFADGAFSATPEYGFTEIREIRYYNLPVDADILIGETSVQPVATMAAGSGVARFRRFRVSDAADDTTVHLLCKRSAPDDLTEDTVIHLSNVNALKHALLGRVAEDNADVQRAEYHWQTCEKLLDEELDAHRGAAKPMLNVDIWGGANKPYNLY
jgi:hypothetical protein